MPVTLARAGLEGKLREMAANITKSGLHIKMFGSGGDDILIGSVYPMPTYLEAVRRCDSPAQLSGFLSLLSGVAGSVWTHEVVNHLVEQTGLGDQRCWIFGDTETELFLMVPPESEQVHSCVIRLNPKYLGLFENQLSRAIAERHPVGKLKVAHRRQHLKLRCIFGRHRLEEPRFVQGPLLWSTCSCWGKEKLTYPLPPTKGD